MRRFLRVTRLVALAAATLSISACSGGSSSTYELPAGETWVRQDGDEVLVEARDNVYVPQFIEVKKGTTITWENTGRNRHNVLPDDAGDFADIPVEELEPGMTASRTFDETGEFGYYCSLHGTATRGMFGAIKVVD
jgi:plastocyanin